MKTSWMVPILCAALSVASVAADNWPGDGGKSDIVKTWPAKEFQVALTAGKPIAAYIFDPEYKNNYRAKHMEGSAAIANIDVRDALKAFQCMRIKSDGTDVRGWPKEMLTNAYRSASLVLMSSDGKKVFPFDKRMSNEQINPAVILAAAQSIIKYEESMKSFRETADKLAGTKKETGKETAAAEPTVDNKVPGLPPPKDDTLPGLKPKDDKKPVTPPTPGKKTPQPTDE